jgi:hypothetical protein
VDVADPARAEHPATGSGVADLAQGGIEPVQDAGVDLGDGQVPEGRLDLGLDREQVAVQGGR